MRALRKRYFELLLRGLFQPLRTCLPLQFHERRLALIRTKKNQSSQRTAARVVREIEGSWSAVADLFRSLNESGGVYGRHAGRARVVFGLLSAIPIRHHHPD